MKLTLEELISMYLSWVEAFPDSFQRVWLDSEKAGMRIKMGLAYLCIQAGRMGFKMEKGYFPVED